MTEWHDYINEVGVPIYTGDDDYGFYTEFECKLTDDAAYDAMDQMREYIPHDEYGIDATIRRYEDQSTRIFLTVVDLDGNDCGTNEMELPTEALEALDTIYLDEA